MSQFLVQLLLLLDDQNFVCGYRSGLFIGGALGILFGWGMWA